MSSNESAGMPRSKPDHRRIASYPTPSQDLFRSVLDTVSGGFTAFDRDWRITYMNATASRLLSRLGKTPDDLLGFNVWETFPELVGTHIYAEYQRAMSEWVEIEFEEYYPPLEAWFQIRLYPSKEGLLAYSHDVTAQKHMATMMSEQASIAALGADIGRALTSVDSLREMLQGCAEAMVSHLKTAFARIWVLNASENMLELEASAGLYTHLDGAHSRVPVGRFKIGLIAEERKPHLTNTVIGDPRVGDQEWARREGMVAFAGYPLLVEERLVGVVAMFARHSLSETVLAALASVADEIGIGIVRKQNENALFSSREWFSTTLQSIGDAVIATDADGHVNFMNRVAESLTGWVQKDAEGKPLTEVFQIVNETTRLSVENPVEKVIRLGGIVGLANHTILIHKDGREVAIDDSAAPIQDTNGHLQGVVLVFRDVTEQRQVERQAEIQQLRQAVMMRYLRAANRTAARVASLMDPLEIAQATVGTLSTDFEASVAGMWLYDAAKQRLILVAENGLGVSPPTSVGREIDVQMNAFKIGWVARFGRPYVGRIQSDDLQYEHQWIDQERLQWAAIYPLNARGHLYGVLAVFLREEMALGGSEALSTLATIIASSLDAAYLVNAANSHAVPPA